MVNKQILNEAFLKSIESEYIFDNAPINRFSKNKENDGADKKLMGLKDKIKSIENCDILIHLAAADYYPDFAMGDGLGSWESYKRNNIDIK